MKKILVVDDEEKIRSIIRKYGEFEGYLVEEATDGMDAIQKVKDNENYDVIIMDVMMPELDGFSACTEIKKINDIPVIMLSARGEEYDRIHGFEAGVDDYVVKPFSPKELMMRVRVVTSRIRATAGKADILKYEGLEINFTARTVAIDGNRIDMSPKEYELLFYLAKNKNIAIPRNRIISEVWGYDYYGDDRTLDTHIKLLRNSLGDYRKCLVTLRGIGYRFET